MPTGPVVGLTVLETSQALLDERRQQRDVVAPALLQYAGPPPRSGRPASFAADRLTTGMEVFHGLLQERPARPWSEQVRACPDNAGHSLGLDPHGSDQGGAAAARVGQKLPRHPRFLLRRPRSKGAAHESVPGPSRRRRRQGRRQGGPRTRPRGELMPSVPRSSHRSSIGRSAPRIFDNPSIVIYSRRSNGGASRNSLEGCRIWHLQTHLDCLPCTPMC